MSFATKYLARPVQFGHRYRLIKYNQVNQILVRNNHLELWLGLVGRVGWPPNIWQIIYENCYFTAITIKVIMVPGGRNSDYFIRHDKKQIKSFIFHNDQAQTRYLAILKILPKICVF